MPKWYRGEDGAIHLEVSEAEVAETKRAVVDPGVRVIPAKSCDKEEALRTIRLIEKGTRQAFLDDELEVEETARILEKVKAVRKACEEGDVDACELLQQLLEDLTTEGGD